MICNSLTRICLASFALVSKVCAAASSKKYPVPQVSLKFTPRLLTACLFGYSKRDGDNNELIYSILG